MSMEKRGRWVWGMGYEEMTDWEGGTGDGDGDGEKEEEEEKIKESGNAGNGFGFGVWEKEKEEGIREGEIFSFTDFWESLEHLMVDCDNVNDDDSLRRLMVEIEYLHEVISERRKLKGKGRGKMNNNHQKSGSGSGSGSGFLFWDRGRGEG